MEEYKQWLEAEIEKERIAVQNGADDTKFKACEDCLRKVAQLEDSGVDFCNLEVGKKYTAVLKDSSSSYDNIFPAKLAVLDKGRDDKGDYIWYYNVTNDTIAFKRYKQFFNGAKYFKEIE